ncbi:MAG TPA: signal peptidase I [Candidatus Woesebacteria bacterium]|nr:signal peptidase I [Candidatus Woesebacteria bacterium]
MSNFLRVISTFILDIFETLVIALSIFLVVYLFLLQPHQVNGKSMVPNFESGDYVLTDKISYRFGHPKRGDVIVFHAPISANCPQGTGCDYIKRVIATPGESVEIKNGKIFVNSILLEENYLPDSFVTNSGDFTRNGPVVMGDNEYFVVGDNRSYSSDSRAWGPVDKELIVGKAFFRYWPPESMGQIKSATY